MKILVFGASGCGTTTLAKEIEKRTTYVNLDVDDYYWKNTEPPFQQKLALQERNRNLNIAFRKFENIIVSGSLVSWGAEWETAFDLAVFIRLSNNERMERLKKREIERYGEKLLTDHTAHNNSKAFLEWANQYEDPSFNGRSLKTHINWIKKLDCHVLGIDGEWNLKTKVQQVLDEVKTIDKTIP